jgi:hypothetical protein
LSAYPPIFHQCRHYRFRYYRQFRNITYDSALPAAEFSEPEKVLQPNTFLKDQLRKFAQFHALCHLILAKLTLPLLEIQKELVKEKQGERTDLQHGRNFAPMSSNEKRQNSLSQAKLATEMRKSDEFQKSKLAGNIDS